jgi:undecaprenyl-diphosphatase
LGILLIQATKHLETTSILSGNVIMLAIGILLIMTAALQLRQPNTPRKTGRSSTPLDALLTGFAQGFSILPGLSRSGLTVAMLIFRGFKETSALRLSFLMSIPIVLGGNIVLNAKDLTLTAPLVAALISAFITGLITIHLLLAFARNINIAYFTFFIGALTIASVFL